MSGNDGDAAKEIPSASRKTPLLGARGLSTFIRGLGFRSCDCHETSQFFCNTTMMSQGITGYHMKC